MEEQLISFEIAKLAKEKGFELDYLISGIEAYNNHGNLVNPTTKHALYLAITQSLLQKWLREKHNINIKISTTPSFEKMKSHKSKYRADIEILFQPFAWCSGKYYLDDTYEEVLTQALLAALKSIKELK